ncbi:MAG: DUF427 domain-containing protein [Pseudomonadota bacterium]
MFHRRPTPIAPGPGQESVWDYPRPAIAEPTAKRIEILFGGRALVDSRRAVRVLETSHPPSYYAPLEDADESLLVPHPQRSLCEWKGQARYFSVRVGDRVAEAAAWTYPAPTPAFGILRDHLAVYPGRMDECRVDGERVEPQPGGFYGGWITRDVVGPFKGGPGTAGW